MQESSSKPYIHINQVNWATGPTYPKALQQVVRWKILVGSNGPAGSAIPGSIIPNEECRMGILELDAEATYPAHSHPAPEIYYILNGTAAWTVDEETFWVESGTAIYHAPYAVHQMTNTGQESLRALWIWWAPGGQIDLLGVGPTLYD